ncbi:MAG: hypothetical protein Q6351_004780 [Candidatus Njordarchaeum guaymaensis]
MKRFLLITLFFAITLSTLNLNSQQYMVIQPYVAADRTYFFIGQQATQKTFLVNNSYITSPRLLILAMNPLVNGSTVKLFNLSIIDLKYITEGNKTRANITVYWTETKPLQVHWKYFVENTIDLPTIEGEHILIIKYLDVKITLKYKIDPFLIRSQQELLFMRFIATLYVAVIITIAALGAIITGKKIIEKVPLPPISPQTLLLITMFAGLLGWIGYSTLQFSDPAMYTSINQFIVEKGIYVIAIAVYILLTFLTLNIFQRRPLWLLFIGIPKQEIDEESKHLKFIAKPIQALKVRGNEIELFPKGIKEWFLWALGVKKKIIIEGDPKWHAVEHYDEYDRVYFLKLFEELDIPKISITLDLYPISLIAAIIALLSIALMIRSQQLPLAAILTVITSILSVLLFLRLRPKKYHETVEENGIKKLVEREEKPDPIIKITGRDTKVELAPPAYAELYKHFLEFLDKKRLVDQARYYRHKYLELEAEFESRLMGEIRDLVKMIAKKMRAVREGEERDEGGSGA